MRYHQPYGVTDIDAGYINGNPPVGVRGSIPPAESIEYPMREVVNLIGSSQQVPSDDDLYQLTRGVRDGKLNYVLDTGDPNALAVELTPYILDYEPGLVLRVKIANNNTGPVAVAVSNLAPTPLRRCNGSELAADDLVEGMVAVMVHDGTQFQLQNFFGVGGGGGGGTTTENTYLIEIPYVADVGTVNTVVAPFSPPITALRPGLLVEVKLLNTITGPTTIAVNNLSLANIVQNDGNPLGPNDAYTGQVMVLIWDGVSWQLVGSRSRYSPGDLVFTALETPPLGTLECNGSTVTDANYPRLAAVMAKMYGGDSTHTKLPDYRGIFLRMWAHGATTDPDRATRTDRGDGVSGDRNGTRQAGNYASHSHMPGGGTGWEQYASYGYGFAVRGFGGSGAGLYDGSYDAGGGLVLPPGFAAAPQMSIYEYQQVNQTHGPGIILPITSLPGAATSGGNETRPINAYVMCCIAY